MTAQLGERRDQPPGTARRAPVARTRVAERERPPIGDDDDALTGRDDACELIAEPVGAAQSSAPAASRAMSMTALVMGGTRPMMTVSAAVTTSPARVNEPMVTERAPSGASRMYM